MRIHRISIPSANRAEPCYVEILENNIKIPILLYLHDIAGLTPNEIIEHIKDLVRTQRPLPEDLLKSLEGRDFTL